MTEPSRQLALISDLEGSGNLTTVGFRLPQEISYDQFEAIGRLFGTAHETLKFAIGDLIVQGRQIFGEEVYQALEGIGLSPPSLMQYARVSERIPYERRRINLTWSHHRAVSNLEPDEQDTWLRRAEEGGWNKQQLEDHLREQREVATTTVREHERKLPTQVVEVVIAAAEQVWSVAEQVEDGSYTVPQDPMEALGKALGERD